MNLQGLLEVLISKRLQQNGNVDKYFDSRQCLQPAYKASASRACLLLQEDGPHPSHGCVVSRAELSRSAGSRQQEGRLLSQGRGRKYISLGSRSEASEPYGGLWNCLRQADGSPLAEPLWGRGGNSAARRIPSISNHLARVFLLQGPVP